MSDEIEPVVAAGPVDAPPHGAVHTCLNCRAVLAGPYCHVCGQAAHVHRSLLHLGEELLHGLLHFDAKGWRTLPLLVFHPGVLTRRYIDGERVRFVSPLALFLFSVFLMFFAYSFVSAPSASGAASEERLEARRELEAGVQEAQAAAAGASAALAAARSSGRGVAAAEGALSNAAAEQRAAEFALGAFDTAQAGAGTPANIKIDTGSARLDAALANARKNPDLVLYKLKGAASKFSFMVVPISLPFLWLMFFWRKDVVAYDHAVFALYSLSFMSVLMTLVAVLQALHAPSVASVLLLVPPLHMYAQLRGTYRLTRLQALWRTAALLLVCAIVCVLFALLVAAAAMG